MPIFLCHVKTPGCSGVRDRTLQFTDSTGEQLLNEIAIVTLTVI